MSNPPTILIVEDDPVFRRVLHFTVTRSGFNSDTASNGEEAFQRLMLGGIDLLVTDLQMPICSGLELLQRLDSLENFRRPGTILCTAKGMELDTEELKKRYGLIAVMHKPFSPRKLADLISRSITDERALNSAAGQGPTGTAPFAAAAAVVSPVIKSLTPPEAVPIIEARVHG